MEEGTLVEWLVKPGDHVETGQVVFEVETDKAAVEVEATDSGRLARVVVEEGETVPVKSVVAYLAQRDEDVDAYMAAVPAGTFERPAGESAVSKAGHSELTAGDATAPPAATGRPKASPAARKAARELGIGLTAVGKGSGPGGRILSPDVEKAHREPSAAPPVAGEALGRPLSRMRRAIAANLTLSAQTIPHFYAAVTVDAAPLVEFRARRKAQSAATVNDIIVWCVARALREFPALRSRIDGDNLVETPSANIGVAVATEEGLVVPVLRRADELTLEELAAESRRIVAAARGGKLEGAGQGVFTVTNLGMYGLDEFAAIINPGEAAILAVGAIREAPVAREGQLRAGRVMTLRLSADHRIIDGAVAAAFLGRVRGLIEEAQFGS
jgi:pyruvate dehydrogenase E2 component (dihydrolipoamide acetyltransferase)